MALSSLGQRVVTAALLFPLVLAALFLLPPLGWAAFALAILAVGAHEWAKLVAFDPLRRVLFIAGTLAAGAVMLLPDVFGFGRGWPDAVVFVACGLATLFWLLVAPIWLAANWPTQRTPAMALVGWIVLLGAWVALVELQARSPWLVLAAMAAVWIADTAAYFAGRAFGKRKLAPSISPGKTWEGVYGGVLAVALYALALVPFATSLTYAGPRGTGVAIAFVVMTMALAAISVVGDLFESKLKRHAGVKDSGALLPGHGGVLDRVDALLAAMPPAALGAALYLAKGPP
jgi:phosphatidate cytidylyltransferase